MAGATPFWPLGLAGGHGREGKVVMLAWSSEKWRRGDLAQAPLIVSLCPVVDMWTRDWRPSTALWLTILANNRNHRFQSPTSRVRCDGWVGNRKMILVGPKWFLCYLVFRLPTERYLSFSSKIHCCPYSPWSVLEKQQLQRLFSVSKDQWRSLAHRPSDSSPEQSLQEEFRDCRRT